MIAIQTRVPDGLRIDQLQQDIDMLVDKGLLGNSDLAQWANQIEKVTIELNQLEVLISRFMPEKTSGKCHGLDIVGSNRLLSLMMDISYTQQQFTLSINSIAKRVLKMSEERILIEKQPQLFD